MDCRRAARWWGRHKKFMQADGVMPNWHWHYDDDGIVHMDGQESTCHPQDSPLTDDRMIIWNLESASKKDG